MHVHFEQFTHSSLLSFTLIKILNKCIIYFSLLVLADTQKLGLKQQLRNLEKQLNDLKVSLAINVAESKSL